jgi:hypothetical protein
MFQGFMSSDYSSVTRSHDSRSGKTNTIVVVSTDDIHDMPVDVILCM